MADLTAPSRANGQSPAPASDTLWGARVSLPHHGLRDEPASISTKRLAHLDDAPRLRVRRYLAGRPATRREIDLLTDVLGEAEGLAGGEPSQAWNRRISDGLGLELLPAYFGEQSFTAELPGISAADLRRGSRILVPGLIHAHKNLESVTSGDVLYVIEESPHGRDVSDLLGEDSDLVMFDRGQDFEVARVRDEDGRRRIVLRPTTGPPGQEATTADPGTSATQRHDQRRRQVRYNYLPSAGSLAPAVESPAVEKSSAGGAGISVESWTAFYTAEPKPDNAELLE